MILAGAVLGTVLATGVLFAGLATILALLQVVATTKFKVDPDYWIAAFVNQFWMATLVLGILTIGMVIYKTWCALQSGGSELARQLGGTRVMTVGLDPQYRQLVHVVEELSVVTGATLPKVFVLENENSINGFAAGLEPRDTVVGVTRGALEHLDRAQLQGLLAHEFSHIVNGDVRINIQTLGALQGIEAIASAASYLLKLGVSSGVNGSMLATAFGCVLWPVGQIGVLFGSLARMALNRQREYLADAAAVQFTRNPDGLSSALKLIAAHDFHGTNEIGNLPRDKSLFLRGGNIATRVPIEVPSSDREPHWPTRSRLGWCIAHRCLGRCGRVGLPGQRSSRRRIHRSGSLRAQGDGKLTRNQHAVDISARANCVGGCLRVGGEWRRVGRWGDRSGQASVFGNLGVGQREPVSTLV